MVTTKQVNVRVPSAAGEMLLRIGARLRKEPQFAARLEQWLAEQEGPSVGSLLSERVADLERRLEALEAGRGAARAAAVTPQMAGQTPTRLPPTAPGLFRDVESAPQSTWTIGEGRGRRLTADGEAELVRLIGAGQSDAAIASALGVKPNTVANRRKGLSAKPA